MTDTTEEKTVDIFPIAGSFMCMAYEKPPVWEEIMAQFKINLDSTLFTYGDVLYNPAGINIPMDYVHHEELHAEQQGHGGEAAGKWWARYFQDQYFRIDQEAKAYAHQYDWWCKNGPKQYRNDKNWRGRKMMEIARTLSSPMYGSVVNYDGAVKLIKGFSKTK